MAEVLPWKLLFPSLCVTCTPGVGVGCPGGSTAPAQLHTGAPTVCPVMCRAPGVPVPAEPRGPGWDSVNVQSWQALAASMAGTRVPAACAGWAGAFSPRGGIGSTSASPSLGRARGWRCQAPTRSQEPAGKPHRTYCEPDTGTAAFPAGPPLASASRDTVVECAGSLGLQGPATRDPAAERPRGAPRCPPRAGVRPHPAGPLLSLPLPHRWSMTIQKDRPLRLSP